MSTPSTTIAGGEWMGQAVMCTRDKEFTIRDIGDCLARGYDRSGSGALPLFGGTPAIAVPPRRSRSAPSLPPSGARTQ